MLESPVTSSSSITELTIGAGTQGTVSLVLRPMADGWVMGEDWTITRSYSSNFLELKEFIEEERGISRHRIQLRLKGKVVVPSRDKWTLRRMGLVQGFVVQVEPTFVGRWWWNPYTYYCGKLLKEVESVIDSEGGGLFLEQLLEKLGTLPPPITTSLRVFLRTFPELIHLYHDTSGGTIWVERAQGLLQAPTFSTVPRQLGHFTRKDAALLMAVHQEEEEEEEEEKEEEEGSEEGEGGEAAVVELSPVEGEASADGAAHEDEAGEGETEEARRILEGKLREKGARGHGMEGAEVLAAKAAEAEVAQETKLDPLDPLSVAMFGEILHE
jgi:hypothetical protein